MPSGPEALGLYLMFVTIGFIAVGDLIILQCLHCLGIALEKFEGKIKICIAEKRFPPDNEAICNAGMSLTTLAEKANRSFGKIIVWMYFSNISTIIVSIFALPLLISSSRHYLPFLCKFISVLLLCVHCMTKLYYLQSVGQALCDSYASIRKNFLRLKFATCENGDFAVANLARIDVLIEQFSGSPITPMDIFNLNYASALTLAGISLTYIIVLLQFKQGDDCSNSTAQPTPIFPWPKLKIGDS